MPPNPAPGGISGDPEWAALLSETHDIVSVIAADRRQIWVSPALERVLGYREVPTSFPAGYVHPDDTQQIIEAFDRLIDASEASVTVQYRVRHADGQWRWVEATGRNRLADPRIGAVVAVTRDITERKQAEERARLDAAGLANKASLADQSPHPAVVHCDGVVRWANEAAAELFEVPLESTVGRPLTEFVPAESAELTARRIAGVLADGSAQAGEAVLRTANGRRIVVETRAARMIWDGRPAVHLVMWDVTQRRAEADRLAWDATHDTLTGLANRALLGDRLRHALAGLRSVPGVVAVMFIDLDGFKTVNDTYGHLVGDDVLRAIGQRLARTVRLGDTAARYGGDEYAVVAAYPGDQDGGEAAVRATAKRLDAAVAEPFAVGSATARVTASIGWATATDPDADPIELFRAADQDAYAVKTGTGRRRRSGLRRPTV